MRSRSPSGPPPISEAELCAAFISFARERGWTAYPETGGWDIVLVRDGLQIGVQAKKHFNATLLRQTIPHRHYSDAGPHYRAILLPEENRDALEVCEFCGIVVFWRTRFPDYIPFAPDLDPNEWFEWPHSRRITLPDYIPDVPAGVASPVRLTEWKVKALRIAAMMEVHGFVTSQDFQKIGIDSRRWILEGWAVRPEGFQRGRYARGPHLHFDKQHPQVYAQIVAELRAKAGTDSTGTEARSG